MSCIGGIGTENHGETSINSLISQLPGARDLLQRLNLPVFKEHELKGENYIGGGGFGKVFHRKLEKDGRCYEVAEKRLKANVTFTAGDKKAVMREAEMLTAKRHKYIILLHGIRFTDNEFCLIMEYMMHGSCSGFLKKDWSTLKVSLIPLKYRIAKQVAETMEFLHSPNPKALLHLDLKSENVLLDDELNVKLCDFGLSKMKQTISRITQQTTGGKKEASGTITHIAPEQLKDPNLEPTTKSDVYSFGILVWELLSDKIPFEHAQINPVIIMLNVKEGKRPDEKLVKEDSPEILKSIMKEAWHEDPNERPQFSDCDSVYDEPRKFPQSQSGPRVKKDISRKMESNSCFLEGVERLVARLLLDSNTATFSKSTQSDHFGQQASIVVTARSQNRSEGNVRATCGFDTVDQTVVKRVLHGSLDTHTTEPPSSSSCGTATTADSGRASDGSYATASRNDIFCHSQSTEAEDTVINDELPLLSNCGAEGSSSSSNQTQVAIAHPSKMRKHMRRCIPLSLLVLVAIGVGVILYFFVFNHCRRLVPENPHENITCTPAITPSSSDVARGTECKVTCQTGFAVRNESSTLICTRTGTWSAPMPDCSKLGVCPSLPQPAQGGHVTCTDGFFEMSVCTFTCPSGSRIRIPSTTGTTLLSSTSETVSAKCIPVEGDTSKMTWSIPEPYCEAVHPCSTLSAPENGQYVCTDSVLSNVGLNVQPINGTICTLKCNDGYDVLGNSASLKCTEKGLWNDTLPTCAKACPVLRTPINGHYNCTIKRFIKSVCRYRCEENFILVGSQSRSCMSDGTWNNNEPRCDCPACRSGSNCQYSMKWSDVVDQMNRSLSPPKDFLYGGVEILCTPNPQSSSVNNEKIFHSVKPACICRDRRNRGRQCNGLEDMPTICEKSLSQLVLMMAYEQKYLLPCDAEKMPQSC